MIDISLAPHRFVQGKGLLSKTGKFLTELGENPLFLADRSVAPLIKNKVDESLQKEGFSFQLIFFGGECCQEEIERAVETIKKKKIDVMVGCGGGKAIDTAKAAAHFSGIPLVALPTSAATCAAWSPTSPLYSRTGEYLETLELRKNADLVLVDCEVIAHAPSRFLSAGMADSLAKWYEGRTTSRGKEGDSSTALALNLSKYVKEVVQKEGPRAKQDVEKGRCSPEVEKIIHANILITGIIGQVGGKNFRSAGAHALNYALCGISAARHTLHGEKVAVGILMQFMLEGKNEKDILRLACLYRKIGLPCSLEELGVYLSSRDLEKVCQKFLRPGSSVYNLPFSVNEDSFKKALLEINSLVKSLSIMRSKFNDSIVASKEG